MKTTAHVRRGRVEPYDKENWVHQLFDTKGSMIAEISSRVTTVLLWTIVVTTADKRWFDLSVPIVAHTIVGGFLSLLLVFRTNASYDRFWEGRRQWGAIVNASRNLGRQCGAYLRGHPEALRDVLKWAVELPWAVMHTLRGSAWGTENLTTEDVESVSSTPHLPTAIATQVSSNLDDARRRGLISDYMQMGMDQNVQQIVDCYGACERIHKTPLPFAYVVHLRRALVLYLFTLPFALLSTFQWGTIPATLLIAYILYGIEEIGVEIEDPFGTDPNDLPLEIYCQGIQKVLNDIIRRAESGQDAAAEAAETFPWSADGALISQTSNLREG